MVFETHQKQSKIGCKERKEKERVCVMNEYAIKFQYGTRHSLHSVSMQ